MSAEHDIAGELCERVTEALADGTPLYASGGDSKRFFGEAVNHARLDVSAHRGIVNYQPTELVVTARAGTALSELQDTLAAQRQQLPFEPPHFGAGATVGGTVACGLSGPARPWQGAVRDLVLGTRMINGRAQHLRFGGEVMKNVAGYDVSRLLTGSLGTLGVITEVSFKVLPLPAAEVTLELEMNQTDALRQFRRWRALPLPITALAHCRNRVWVRLAGTEAGVSAARARVSGEVVDGEIWHSLREHQHNFFSDDGRALWRVSVAPASGVLTIPSDADAPCLIEWGGAQRWFVTHAPAGEVRELASNCGGHAVCYRGANDASMFHPLAPPVLALHRRIKQALDPQGIFNPGRLYRGL